MWVPLGRNLIPDKLGKDLVMSDRKLYVGNLPFSVNDDKLRDIFAPFGPVSSANVVTDKMSGRSRGFGFVEMGTPEGASASINALNGKEMDGRPLTVNIARPRTDRPERGGDRGGGG